MPIYEYRCSACGFQKEFLQRLSEPPHTKCPECGKRKFIKLVTAAGFQLKGSGWYATDFKNSGSKPAAKGKADKSEPAKESSGKDSGKDGGAKDSAKSESKPGAGATPASS